MHGTKNRITSLALGLLFATPIVWAQADKFVELLPIPGKQTCSTLPTGTTDASLKREICVTQGNFAHDLYVVKIDGTVALKGVDDDTSAGIASTFRGTPLTLQCKAQNLPGDVTLEEVQKALPNRPIAKAQELVELMKGSLMGVEVARLCTLSVSGVEQPKVQVIFD